MVNTFKSHRPGKRVPGDGNCGLYALCKVLYDDQVAATPNAMLYYIFFIFELHDYPDYWWSDEELAVIADYFGYDMYIYNQTDHTGIVFGRGERPALVLYSVNGNTHWMPGTRTKRLSNSYLPHQFTVVQNVVDVLTIDQIAERLRIHLLNSRGGEVADVVKSKGLGARIKTAVLDKLDKVCSWANCTGTEYGTLDPDTAAYGCDVDLILRDAKNIARSVYDQFYRNNNIKSGCYNLTAKSLMSIVPCCSEDTASDIVIRGDRGAEDQDGERADPRFEADQDNPSDIIEIEKDEPVDGQQSDNEVEVVYGRADEGENADGGGRVYVRKRAVPLPSTSDSDEYMGGSDGPERDGQPTPERGTQYDEHDVPSAHNYEE